MHELEIRHFATEAKPLSLRSLLGVLRTLRVGRPGAPPTRSTQLWYEAAALCCDARHLDSETPLPPPGSSMHGAAPTCWVPIWVAFRARTRVREARTMPIRTGKPTCQERSARTVVWRGFGKVLVARHDAQIEVEARNIRPGRTKRLRTRPAVRLARRRHRRLAHRRHAGGHLLVVHQRIVKFDDLN